VGSRPENNAAAARVTLGAGLKCQKELLSGLTIAGKSIWVGTDLSDPISWLTA